MRWLWKYGLSWAQAQVAESARRAASEQAQSTAGDSHTPAGESIAVLAETKWLFDAVADVLTSTRHFEGDQLAVCTGKLAGAAVIVARPRRQPPQPRQLITALVDGHHPRFVIAASEAVSLSSSVPVGSLVVASRVHAADGSSLRLDGRAPDAAGYFTGAIGSPRETAEQPPVPRDQAPLAEDRWSAAIAQACQQADLPLLAVAVVLQPCSAQQSPEVASLKRQKSFAGRAGVLTGMLWKKRSGLRDAWNEKQAAWEAATRLARLVSRLAKSDRA